MITSVHTLIYSDDAPATRAFLRDVLGLRGVAGDESDPGWLIFQTGPSEMGVHPTYIGSEDDSSPRHHEIALMCDEVEATRADLEAKGATFIGPIRDAGFGLMTFMEVPGADPIILYQPKHATAYDL